MGIYDCINLFGNFQLSSAPFLVRRIFDAGITIMICFIGFSTINGMEYHRPYLEIKQRIRYKTHVIASLGLIIPLIVLVLFAITPTYKYIYDYTIKELNNESNTMFLEEISPSEDGEKYSDDLVWTDEQKEEFVNRNIDYVAYVGLFFFYLGTIISPFYILYEYAEDEESSSPIIKARFRLPPVSKKASELRSLWKEHTVCSLWKGHNWNQLIELEAESAGLTKVDVLLFSKGIQKAETDKNGKYKKDENGKRILKNAGIETLLKVNLDHNNINEMIQPWNSHNIREFSCSNCNLTNLEGLRTLGFIEKLDIHNNEISNLQFLLQSRAYLSLRELNVSDNYIPQEEFDSVLSNCINLERLSMAKNDGPNSLEFLRNMKHLVSLNVSWAEISDLSPLLGKSFIFLSLVNCELEDIAVLGEGIIETLSDDPVELDLRGNHITDISALPAMKYKNLRLSYNPISDFSHLQYLKGDTLEVSFSGDWDFLDQLDYMNGFRHIIIQQVSLEAEGHIRRKLENKMFDISTDSNNPYTTESVFD